ncbi:MAG: FecR domain-containing protein [Desulfobacteraceae bacterium]|uniref:FecR domain-containing protein n=1 Tax=Candidatus Desulfaltia bathyphila TaxID=2841697 RepID=A0A8J6N6L5_9BACT|nr:FecR domain-containing protein [Candidatus Desulfaltia bathyphila]MBL7196108.1 FecR domain-containing protein [Desulfobacterales bacterium]
MKKLSKISLVICLCLASFPSFAGPNRQVAGAVTFMMGDVFVSHDKTAWVNADFDMKIHQGDQIRTEAESRCEITLEDGTLVRMDENSFQQFEKCMVSKTAKEVSLFLSSGKMWLNARKILAKSDSFKVRTNKAVCAIRGTKFRVDTDDEQTRISVHKGVVATWSALFDKPKPKPDASILEPKPIAGPHPVSMERWVEIVKAFQQITIDSNGKYEKKDFNINSIMEDQWIRWNMARDNDHT